MSVKGEGQFTVYVVGAEEVLAKIEEVKGWVSYILATEPGKIAKELRDRIRQKAESLFTRRTGRLFESIKAHPISGSDAWMVTAGGAQAPYAVYWEFGWCHHKSGRCFRRPFFYNTAYEYAKENNLEFGGGVFPERIISLYGRERGERIIKGLGEVGITKRFSKGSFRSSAKVRVRKVKTPKFRIRR